VTRFASIDIGTNAVLLLVAERGADGRFKAIVERSDITRLGRGVDETGVLSREGMDETLHVVERFVAEARSLGARDIAASATSAARDAHNGAVFLAEARDRAALSVEILSGDVEAQLSYRAASEDFAVDRQPLVVLDVGGGSTELIYGRGRDVGFRRSFNIGSVRLTERFIRHDPPTPAERSSMAGTIQRAFTEAPAADPGTRVVGLAGTVTTLYAMQHGLAMDDLERIQGGTLGRHEIATLADRLFALQLTERRLLTGLHPKRADVICAGALLVLGALEQLGAAECLVSDRGLRWGLLRDRFGGAREHAVYAGD
jgi:exopolyphosphatase/guanosine-5'-triphosphate,3'-diphosphate pyrophosphatase